MSKIASTIAKEIVSNYSANATLPTFFGIELGKIDKDTLEYSVKRAINMSDLNKVEEFEDRAEELNQELVKKQEELDEFLAKKQAAFELEMTEAKAAFDHALALKETEFARAQEIKNLSMEHTEKLFVTESGFTKEFLATEMANARKIHDSEIATLKAKNDADIATQTAKFAQELTAAQELAQSQIAHNKAIADAEIEKAKQESSIKYTYDRSVLEQLVKSEVATRYDELLKIAYAYESRELLLAKLEEDKEYFKNFSTERVERSENVTDLLIEKIKTSECKPVVVNVTEVKKGKKNND